MLFQGMQIEYDECYQPKTVHTRTDDQTVHGAEQVRSTRSTAQRSAPASAEV
jgi:hypothetical protein